MGVTQLFLIIDFASPKRLRGEYMSGGAASRTLVKRAVSCSFSSIFHLRNAGLDTKQFDILTNVFKGVVIVPALIFGGVTVAFQLTK